MKACPKETIDIDKDSHPQYFEPDHFYSDEEPITMGNVTIHSMLTLATPLAALPSSGR